MSLKNMIDVGVYKTSQLFTPTPAETPITGKCVVCGFKTDKGHEIDFSDNFTSWNLLQEGNCICEHCYTLCRDQQYRRKSWVATAEGIKFLKKDEILQILLKPPSPPFSIYITKTGKKQGFLQLINKINYSKEQYFIAFDENLLFVNRRELEEMVRVAEEARRLKFTKTELLTKPSSNRWRYRGLCEKIVYFSKNPVWEVVVYAVK